MNRILQSIFFNVKTLVNVESFNKYELENIKKFFDINDTEKKKK